MIRVSVDNTKCIAAGLCVGREPGIFDQNDDDGLVFVHRENVLADEQEGVIESERICPSGAIVVHTD
ncbi:ferredoxin [Rhodococcus koreensis]